MSQLTVEENIYTVEISSGQKVEIAEQVKIVSVSDGAITVQNLDSTITQPVSDTVTIKQKPVFVILSVPFIASPAVPEIETGNALIIGLSVYTYQT